MLKIFKIITRDGLLKQSILILKEIIYSYTSSNKTATLSSDALHHPQQL